MLRKDAKIELIRHVPLFAHCSRRELQQVASLADEVDLPVGKQLNREGVPGREFFVLVKGSADVTRDGQRIRSLKDGDFFGEIALVTNRPRTATVTTISPAKALVMTRRAFRDLLSDSKTIHLKVLEALADRLGDDLQ
ncbi:MAG: cyclic nucleotide-binding domain-containing protein [Gaiellaceae bacterium]